MRQLIVGKRVGNELGVLNRASAIDIDLPQDDVDLLFIKNIQLLKFDKGLLELKLRVVILEDRLLFV